MAELYAALVHYPVVDRGGSEVVASVTNFDVHDMSRTARTYGLAELFIVTPIEAQQALVERICAHWLEGAGGERIPERKEALELCRLVPALEDAVRAVEQRHSIRPVLVATSANPRGAAPLLQFAALRTELARPGPPVLLLFGTSHGLAPRVVAAADHLLEPITGAGAYNHLSVRSAFAIVLDRLADARTGPARPMKQAQNPEKTSKSAGFD